MLHREVTKNELSITEDDAPILTCCYGDLERPSYFHPLYAPNGQAVTEDAANRAQYHPPGLCFILGTLNGEQLPAREREPILGETEEEFAIVTTYGAPEPLLIETLTTQVYPRHTEVQVLDIEISLTRTHDCG